MTTSSSSKKPFKKQRLEVRCAAFQKELIERAAMFQGRKVSDFVMNSLQEAAIKTIREHQVLELGARDSRAFAESLLNPPAPNKALQRAAANHQRLIHKP